LITAADTPAPLHWFSLQSPEVCAEVTVPAAVLAKPQAPRVHVRAWHSVSTPGHVEAVRHCTQTPAPLHKVPPFCAQTEPALVGGFEGTPLVQTSFEH
jgi:hypothetical protein